MKILNKSKIIKTLKTNKSLMAEAIFMVYYTNEAKNHMLNKNFAYGNVVDAMIDTTYQISIEIDDLQICKQNFFKNVYSNKAWNFYQKDGIIKVCYLKSYSINELIENITQIIIDVNAFK